VLLLDEPTRGWIPRQIHETREVIRAFGDQHAPCSFSTTSVDSDADADRRICGPSNSYNTVAARDRFAERAARCVGGDHRVMLQVSAPAADVRAELLSVKGVLAVTFTRSRATRTSSPWIARSSRSRAWRRPSRGR